MIDSSISTDTAVTLGTAIVVVTAAVKGAMVLVNIHRDLSEIRAGMLRRSEFEVWSARLGKSNPDLKVPDLQDEHA